MPTLDEIFSTSSSNGQATSQKDVTSTDQKPSLDEIFSSSEQSSSSSTPQLETDITKLTKNEESRFPAYQPSPVNIGQRIAAALPKNLPDKIEALKRSGVNPDLISVAEDGSLNVGGSPINPTPEGFADFFRELPANAAITTINNAPLVGQIGADALAVGLAAPSGGLSLLGAIGANAAGAAAGESARQLGAFAVSGEKINPNEIKLQGAIGGAVPPIAKGIGVAGKAVIGQMAKPLSALSNKFGDSLPGIMESVGQIPREETADLVSQMRIGRNPESILNPKVADSRVPTQIKNRVFFGDENAEETTSNLINTYKKHVSGVSDKNQESILDEFYRNTFGISQETLNSMKVYDSSELTSAKNTADFSYRSTAEEVQQILNKAGDSLEKKYGEVLDSTLKNYPNAKIQLKSAINDMIAGGERSQILIDGKINPNYTGKEASKVYQSVLDRFKVSSGLNPKNNPEALKLLSKDPSMAKYLGFSDVSKYAESLSPREAYSILKDLKPLLNKSFERGLSNEEQAPLAGFLEEIRNQISGLGEKTANGLTPLQDINSKYGKFKDLSKLFGGLNGNNPESILRVGNTLKSAYQDGSLSSYVKDIDNFIPESYKIYPKIRVLGAAQELNDKSSAGLLSRKALEFTKKIRNINQRSEDKALLSVFDSSLKDKFMRKAQDHSIASTYASRPQNLFRARAMVYLIGGGALGAINPALGAAALVGGIAATSPQGLSKALIYGSKAASGEVPMVNEQAGRAALATLVHRQLNK